MKRNMKNLLSILIILFICIIAYIYNHRTTYDNFNNEDIINDVKVNLDSNQEIVIFESKNPFNFFDILHDLEKTSNQTVYAIITYPEIIKDKYEVVIGVSGSLGWGEHHYKYLTEYRKLGIATISLHSFKSRGVKSTVGDQIAVTIPMVIHDAYSLLKKLSSIDKFLINKVAITGWSLGGGVSLFSAWKPLQEKLSPDLKFAAHLPFYPPCIAKLDNPIFTDVPMHILAGKNDNWVPSEPCENLINELNQLGYSKASITVYNDAHHSFDRNREIVTVPDAYKLENCRLLLDDDGIVSTNTLIKIPMKNGLMQKMGLMFCAEKGPTMGGNAKARKDALLFSKKFMKMHLLN